MTTSKASDQGAMVVPARVIRGRLNGLDHQTLPLDVQTLTGFIDVHDDLLYYSVVAWSDDFTGYVIDYKPQIVENAIRLAVGRSTVVVHAKGKSIRATNQPMSEWKRKSGERHGNHWMESTPSGRMRTVTVDTNFWKCQVHDAFRLLPGNPGSLTLWGRDAETHRMFSEHMNAEVAKLVESGGNSLYEWQDTPNDNHLFDCMVGSMVAASHCGIKSAEERVTKTKRRRNQA